MLSILNNNAVMQAQTALNNTSASLNTALQRLSTGLQINSGADGPAAYVISQAQQTQISGLNQAIENTSQAVNLVQTGSGALNEIDSLLTQVRSLAVDSANTGVNDWLALAANQSQINNALSTINSIASSTQFNGKPLLDGSAGYNATATNGAVTDLSSTAATELGVLSLDVTQGAQAGQIDVSGAASYTTSGNLSNLTNLGQNETLTFNGSSANPVYVYLTQGMSNSQVVAAINAQTSQIGAAASLDDVTGALVLTDQNLGQNFTVVSNVAAGTAGSTGIDTTTLDASAAAGGAISLTGQSAAGTLTDAAGNAFAFGSSNGNVSGNQVTLDTGAVSGLSFQLALNPQDSAETDPNALGNSTITTSNGSLQFQIGANAGQTADLSIANMQTFALGIGVANNQFSNLSQINVNRAGRH